jgi:hypothetical protein
MEKLTCNGQFTDVTFYCVQPISIRDEVWLDLFSKRMDVDFIKENFQPNANKVKWLADFAEIHSLYQSLIVLDELNISPGILQDCLNVHVVKDELRLGGCLDLNKTKAYLTLDLRFAYFILVYEIHFKIPDEFLLFLLQKKYLGDFDFYNVVRNLIVKEHDFSEISTWGGAVRSASLSCIQKIVVESTKLDVVISDLEITNNSGNITCVVDSNCIDDAAYSDVGRGFANANNVAERLQHKSPGELEQEKIDLGGNRYYLFNGRFHTIFLRSSADLYRYIPIQFHMQYLWFFLVRINVVLEKINLQLTSNSANNKFSKLAYTIDDVINKVEIMTLHNENFKCAIERDNKNIYSKIEGNWNLELLLKNSNRYALFFKDYLLRLQARRSARTEARQNQILFFISIIQMLTIVSVWNDYVALNAEQTTQNTKSLVFLFGSEAFMKLFNLILPLGLVVLVSVLLAYIFYGRHKD